MTEFRLTEPGPPTWPAVAEIERRWRARNTGLTGARDFLTHAEEDIEALLATIEDLRADLAQAELDRDTAEHSETLLVMHNEWLMRRLREARKDIKSWLERRLKKETMDMVTKEVEAYRGAA